VQLGGRAATSDSTGAFRIEGLVPGRYQIAVRCVGYHPYRAAVDVTGDGGVVLIHLDPTPPVMLPPVIVEGHRTGVYGVIADLDLQPMPGARVHLLGPRGGAILTDSSGRFAFPHAAGDYLVRVSLAGYQERRFSLSVSRGKGREVSVALAAATPRYLEPGRAELAALVDLERRLAWARPRNVLTRRELVRFGAISLCEIPELRNLLGSSTWGIVDGWRNYHDICVFQADEVELVEWGRDVCDDPTGTAAAMFAAECTVRRGRATGARLSGRGYLLVWQRW
jgi:hypothetical protein